MWTQCVRGLFYDIHAHVASDVQISTMHEAAEVFDPHAEQVRVQEHYRSKLFCVHCLNGGKTVQYVLQTGVQVPASHLFSLRFFLSWCQRCCKCVSTIHYIFVMMFVLVSYC